MWQVPNYNLKTIKRTLTLYIYFVQMLFVSIPSPITKLSLGLIIDKDLSSYHTYHQAEGYAHKLTSLS